MRKGREREKRGRKQNDLVERERERKGERKREQYRGIQRER